MRCTGQVSGSDATVVTAPLASFGAGFGVGFGATFEAFASASPAPDEGGAIFVVDGDELLCTASVSCAQRAGFAAIQCADGFSANFGAGAGVALVNGMRAV